ncbi:DUF7285 family protein [Halegenticoccus tardaugens]|uniref:DUF7285 family protein n=1 Tax=Halegenticoccus tardaugens TaxID=2071624 RepID=UPI00100C335C|nr:hypothetical protein [Halegenticoccus tardaugens]
MPRWSARETRGQAEPTAALAAVFAVCLGLGLYAGILGDATPTTDRDLAEPTLDRVHGVLSSGGVVDAADRGSLVDGRDVGPDGYEINVSVRTAEREWSAGPVPPGRADRASRSVSVRRSPGRISPGELRVAVWP